MNIKPYKQPQNLLTTSMKKIALLCIYTLLSFISRSQPTETSIIIVPCQSGTLLLDGTVIGEVEANDAKKCNVSFGEHYLQLKTASDKYNLTLNIDQNFKSLVKIGCEAASIQDKSVRLIEKDIALRGALSSDVDQNMVALDAGDELIVNCSVLNKKGNATIMITDYNTKQDIFKKEQFSALENARVKIPAKGIYYYTLYTDALFGKDAKLVIDRIPSPGSRPGFNTNVKVVYDTTATEVLNTIIRVYSTTNIDHSNKSLLKINLPANTAYWTYWIGVGQQAQENMKTLISSISAAGSFFSLNPLILFGMKLLPGLPVVNAPSAVSYRFLNTVNGQLFAADRPYSYYTFKYANNITTDFSLIKGHLPDLALALNNESSLNGENVEIRVVAFSISRRYEMAEE